MSAAAGQPSDRLTFWRNWYDASRQLPDDMRLAWLDAVLDYAFGGVEPSPADGEAGLKAAIAYQAVAIVRATIDISRKRREIGSKGGEARSKAQAKAKQSASKSEAKRKQKRSKAQANPNQEQVQEQVQEQEQEHNAIMLTATTARGGKTPTIEQFVEGANLAGVPEEFARQLFEDLRTSGWADAEGRRVGNWRRYLKTAWNAEQKKIPAARGYATLDDYPMAR